MNNSQDTTNSIETAGIAALSAASKSPFKTAFLITLGLSLARLVMFLLVLTAITTAIILVKN